MWRYVAIGLGLGATFVLLVSATKKRFLKKDLQKFQDKFDKINSAKDIDELASLYSDLDLTDKMRDALQNLGKSFDDIRFKIDNTLELIEHHSKTTKTNKLLTNKIKNQCPSATLLGWLVTVLGEIALAGISSPNTLSSVSAA